MDYLLSVLDSKEAPPSIPAHCSGLKPRVEHARIDEILVHLDGPTEGCYAVIPVNYSRLIEASATVESGSTRPLKTIRSHQTLLGIELTPGTKTLSVRPKSLLGRQQIIWQWLIGVFCIGVWWIYSRKQSNQKLGCQ
jgi:hypothetical protein